MSLYSDFLAPEKHRDGQKPAISDRTAIIFALASVAVIALALIGGTRLLLAML